MIEGEVWWWCTYPLTHSLTYSLTHEVEVRYEAEVRHADEVIVFKRQTFL